MLITYRAPAQPATQSARADQTQPRSARLAALVKARLRPAQTRLTRMQCRYGSMISAKTGFDLAVR